MELASDYKPEFESLAKLLLELARERSTDRIFKMVVQRLGERPHVALAALWLANEGDRCSSCLRQAACSDKSQCLYLVARARFPSPSTDAAPWVLARTDLERSLSQPRQTITLKPSAFAKIPR
jgi:hypothetical protein